MFGLLTIPCFIMESEKNKNLQTTLQNPHAQKL